MFLEMRDHQYMLSAILLSECNAQRKGHCICQTKVAIARNNGVGSSRFLHFKRYRPYFCCPNLSIVPKFLVLRNATIQVHPRFQLHKCNASALMLHSIPYADIQ